MSRPLRLLALLVLLLVLGVPAAGAWTWPVGGPVLQGFSFDPAHPYAGGQHRGVDVGGDAGASVLAPAAGVVSFAGTVPTSGKSVTIDTADGLSVTLTHLGSIAVAKGVAVAEGTVVGTVGPSGTPELDVPYVHLGVRNAADPQGTSTRCCSCPSLRRRPPRRRLRLRSRRPRLPRRLPSRRLRRRRPSLRPRRRRLLPNRRRLPSIRRCLSPSRRRRPPSLRLQPRLRRPMRHRLP